MHTLRCLALAALLLAACASTKGAPEPARVAPAPEPAAAPAPAEPSEAPTTCVQRCVDGRRMEAVGWEVIEAECRRECEASGEKD